MAVWSMLIRHQLTGNKTGNLWCSFHNFQLWTGRCADSKIFDAFTLVQFFLVVLFSSSFVLLWSSLLLCSSGRLLKMEATKVPRT